MHGGKRSIGRGRVPCSLEVPRTYPVLGIRKTVSDVSRQVVETNSVSETGYSSIAIMTYGSTAAKAQGGQTLYNGIVLPQVWPPSQIPSQVPVTPSYVTTPPAVIPIDIGEPAPRFRMRSCQTRMRCWKTAWWFGWIFRTQIRRAGLRRSPPGRFRGQSSLTFWLTGIIDMRGATVSIRFRSSTTVRHYFGIRSEMFGSIA